MQRESLYVLDILESIANIQQDISGKSFDDFRTDRPLTQVVLHNLMIIGEAAANIPRDVRNRYARVPWGAVIGMRNVVVHAYFSVDLQWWGTITRNLADLEDVVQEMLAKEFPEPPRP